MNILRKVSSRSFLQRIPVFELYIHLKDHNKKINPEKNKLELSYMDPRKYIQQAPKQKHYVGRLRLKDQKDLDKKVFEDYKNKILEGKIDEEEVVEADPLWGEEGKPVHFYKNLSDKQATWISHSVVQDVKQLHWAVVKDYFSKVKPIHEISDCQNVNDFSQLAVNYRLSGVTDREKYHEIETAIGKQFHKLSNQSLILLKFAFASRPKVGTPVFHKIINDLLIESLDQLNLTELTHLFYANKNDRYRLEGDNLQKQILIKMNSHFKQLSLKERVDWIFLFCECRQPTIRRGSHNRYHNQIREKAEALIYKLNLDQSLSDLSEEYVLKLAYSLIRLKTHKTAHITENICHYLLENISSISSKSAILFFIYLSEIQSGKSVPIQIMEELKKVVVSNWQDYAKIDQIRALYAMLVLNMYDDPMHELYTNVEMEADNTLIAYFCRIQMMKSSGREWQVMHMLAQFEELPVKFFQDYKRFYNYVKVTAPDWDLTPIENKLSNVEPYYDCLRFESHALDKRIYSGLHKFKKFSELRCLPHSFRQGIPVRNLEFVEFALPQHQISIDVVTDVELIPNTRELKGSFLAKVQSLQNLGWRHLYIFEEDVKNLEPLQMFDYFNETCAGYIEDQKAVLLAAEQYRSYELEQIRNARYWQQMSGKEMERLINTGKTAEEEQNQLEEDPDLEFMDEQMREQVLAEKKAFKQKAAKADKK